MAGGDSVLDSIFDEDTFEDVEDVDMLDVEEGELVEPNSATDLGQNSGGDVNIINEESRRKNQRRRNKKRKNKRKKGSSGLDVTNIDRFVLDVCRRLKEKKSYLVYTAVGCLGMSALSDLVKEVEAVQACGGQKTADGRRFRTGGGILWCILKTRDPNAYQEIMKKGKEFEKQFNRQNIKQAPPVEVKEAASRGFPHAIADQNSASNFEGSQHSPRFQNQLGHPGIEQKRASVHDRIRMPVTYDDLVGDRDPTDE